MGLTKRKDGYYVEFPVMDDGKALTLARGTPGARIKRWKVGSNNRTQAKQQEAMIKTDLMKGLMKSKKRPPVYFSDWANQYLGLPEVKELATYQDRVESVHYQLIPFFGQKLLSEITPANVEEFRTQRKLRRGGLPSLATINADHAFLKHMFGIAERKGLVSTNPAKKVPIPIPRNERNRVLSEKEWKDFYEAAPDHIRPILLIAYHLGMRLGEILNLTWNRVNLQRGVIELYSHETKNREGRQIPLTHQVLQSLKELARIRSLTCNHVFQYNGRPIKRIKRAVRTAMTKAKIENFRFHDLRHCAATNLRKAGVDTITAMKIVGHKSELMHRRYNSVSEADLLQAASKINTYLTPTDSSLHSESISA